MKRIAVFCDGTWQKPNVSDQTNVVKLARIVSPQSKDGTSQIVYYDPGVGSKRGTKTRGGLLGKGLNTNIMQAYLFLALNYEAGDEIYLFGYSRGAYTVRSLAGLIYCCGLLKREGFGSLEEAMQLYRDPEITPGHNESVEFRKKIGDRTGDGLDPGRIPIKFLGCFDTVGALGVPDVWPLIPLDKWLNRKYRFHDHFLNRKIEFAAHAVAADEVRKPFHYVTMEVPPSQKETQLSQMWFPGVHGSVGGGKVEQAPLADGPLLWIKDLASGGFGSGSDVPSLEFEMDVLSEELRPAPNPSADYADSFKGFMKIAGRKSRDFKGISETNDIDKSVVIRMNEREDYFPKALSSIEKILKERIERLFAPR
ncbi:MAG: DUF2235 domain-containing protein [Verrucomicrobiota bacterium]